VALLQSEEMKLTRLRITIEPWHMQDSMKELRVKAVVDGISHVVSIPLVESDFESRFEFMMERAMQEIKKLVKAQEKGQ